MNAHQLFHEVKTLGRFPQSVRGASPSERTLASEVRRAMKRGDFSDEQHTFLEDLNSRSLRDALVAEILQMGHLPRRSQESSLYQRYRQLDKELLNSGTKITAGCSGSKPR